MSATPPPRRGWHATCASIWLRRRDAAPALPVQAVCSGIAARSLQHPHRTVLPQNPPRPPPVQEVVSRLPLCTAEEFNAAVASAKEAFPKWRSVPVPQRARVMFKLQAIGRLMGFVLGQANLSGRSAAGSLHWAVNVLHTVRGWGVGWSRL